MDGRRRPHPHPQIEAGEDSVGLTRRIRRHRRKSPAAPEYLPFNEDMLREILVRLPPQPSSLLRASAVCKRWRSLLTDTKFLRLFRAHHRNPPPPPPLLGVFEATAYGMVFKSILDPPNSIPPQRFDLGRHSGVRGHYLLNCRHGCLLLKAWAYDEVFVCDPMTGHHRRLVAPPEFVRGRVRGAVLCTAGDHGHVHGGCHLSSYKVVLVSSDKRPLACVYSLETGQWGNLIPTKFPCEIYDVGTTAATLVGNVLYWLFKGSDHTLGSDRILAFDLDRQNLAVTVGPPVTNDFLGGHRKIIKAEDGAVGFAILARSCFHMWQKNDNGQGVSIWMPWKTIEMHSILGLSRQIGEEISFLLGYDEDNDVIFVHASRMSMRFNSSRCIPRNFMEPIVSIESILLRVSIHQSLMVDLMELKCCTIHRMLVQLDVLKWFSCYGTCSVVSGTRRGWTRIFDFSWRRHGGSPLSPA